MKKPSAWSFIRNGSLSLFDVRFGSKADISERIRDVCFTPESGHAERQHRANADIRRGLNQLSELASGFDLLRVWWPVYRPELICRRPEYSPVCGIHELRGFMNL